MVEEWPKAARPRVSASESRFRVGRYPPRKARCLRICEVGGGPLPSRTSSAPTRTAQPLTSAVRGWPHWGLSRFRATVRAATSWAAGNPGDGRG
jgi:hypothetical protein